MWEVQEDVDISQVVRCYVACNLLGILSRMGNDARHKMHSKNIVRTVASRRVVVVVGYSTGIIKCRTSFASCVSTFYAHFLCLPLSYILCVFQHREMNRFTQFRSAQSYMPFHISNMLTVSQNKYFRD